MQSPDYGNAFWGRMNLRKLLQIVRTKMRTKQYVLLYMGVDEKHREPGKAMAEAVMRELKGRGASSVGARLHVDKVNGRYFKELIEFEYHYALMEQDFTKK